MHGSAPWKTEETIVGLPRLLVLSVFSRTDSPDLVAVTFHLLLVPFPKGEVPGAKQHGEPVLLRPAIDGPCPGTDHSLGISQDNEVFPFEGTQFIDDPFFDHELLVVSEQDGEARRLIVLVIRERCGDAEPAHHLERDMIDDAGLPRLATVVSGPCFLDLLGGRFDQQAFLKWAFT